MPTFDWNGLVPIQAAQLATGVAAFMGLSFVAGILTFRIALQLGSTLFTVIKRLMVDAPRESDIAPYGTANTGQNDGDDIEGTGDQYGGTAYINNAGGDWVDDWQGNRGSHLGRFSQSGERIADYGTVSQEDLDDMSDAEIEELYASIDHDDMVDENDARWAIGAERAYRQANRPASRGIYVDNMEIGSPYYFAERVSREPDEVDEAIGRGRRMRANNYWNRPGRAEEDRKVAEHWVERWG